MNINMMAVTAGFLLDLALGDPHGLPHPVRAIGHLISALEKGVRALFPASERGERCGGMIFTLLVVLITGGASGGLLAFAYDAGPWAGFTVHTILCYYALAARSLSRESMKVYSALAAGDTEGARKSVSMIVGRDTAALTETGIIKAAVETVAENTSDGVTAPLIYLALGGPVLGWIYKAVNTMDSMVGYKNETYRNFGRAAAKLDDLLNLIPSRLSAVLMIISARFLGMDGKNAAFIYKRDRKNHKSPNSAQTEAVCAGALRIQLAGDAVYFGRVVKKPTIGDPLREAEYQDIKRANRLMYLTAVLCLAVLMGLFGFI